ncbi:MAG: hypothetical protein ABJD11_09515 [Gemmatimonadota bacterium]
MRPMQRYAVVSAFFAFGLAACSSANNTGPGAPSLTQSQSDAVGELVAADADAEIDAAASTGSNGIDVSIASIGGFTANHAPPLACATRTPASPVDTDGDAVPDSVRYDFSTCVISRPFFTDSLSGTIDFIDPAPSVAGHQVKKVFTDFGRTRTRTISGHRFAAIRNGIRDVTRDSSVLQHSETAFRTDYTYNDASTATHLRTWSSAFTADVAGSIAADTPLPSGTWNITGNSTWTHGGNSWSLAVTTNPQLHYDANCTDAPRFDAGIMTAVVTRNGETSTVTITYTACGQFTVTRS